jgi:hypothetical protein
VESRGRGNHLISHAGDTQPEPIELAEGRCNDAKNPIQDELWQNYCWQNHWWGFFITTDCTDKHGWEECGVRLLTDRLGGMDDPAKWDRRGKIETRASSLAGGLFFRRLSRPATASTPLFIRAHPSHLTQSLPLFRSSGQP